MKITVNTQSSIRLEEDVILYFDPLEIKQELHDADYIFITHRHYDHFSLKDIKKVMKETTKLILPVTCIDAGKEIVCEKIFVEPKKHYEMELFSFDTIPAYNIEKQFHLKEYGWVGYLVKLHGKTYYVAGDTDVIPEQKELHPDVAFFPIGGTYTMTKEEAATLANEMKPRIVVPIHYGSIVGTKKDAETFQALLDAKIECRILMPL